MTVCYVTSTRGREDLSSFAVDVVGGASVTQRPQQRRETGRGPPLPLVIRIPPESSH